MGRSHRLWCFAMGVLTAGCILEDNPFFGDDTTGTSGPTSVGTTVAPPTSTTAQPTDDTADTTGTTSGSSSSDSGIKEDMGTDPPQVGCDDPEICATHHVGPASGTCPHTVDGAETSTCDYVGTNGLVSAVADVAASGEGALIILHNGEGVASYAGGVDVPGRTTIRSAPDATSSSIRVLSQDDQGVLRLPTDGVHLQGFSVVVRYQGQWAITMRADAEAPGTESGHHMIENLVMVATRPENVGNNSISSVFQSIGHDSVVRNNHAWGYFQAGMDMRHASDSVLSHNTVFYFQAAAGEPAIDARDTSRLEISNNVFASLTEPAETFIQADGATGLVVAGNALEGYGDVLSGLDEGPDASVVENTQAPLEMESPRRPFILADSTLSVSDMGASGGTSLDGVDLPGRVTRRPGAYQESSQLSLPRPSVVRVGDGTCGGSGCDFSSNADNELQLAVWSAWPEATVELHPSMTAYAGPVVVSWPIVLRGAGGQPEDVVISRQIEDSTFDADGLWGGKNAVIDLTQRMAQGSVVENLTIEAGSGQIAIAHEGADMPAQRHEIRRVHLRDDGAVAGAPADMALYLGSEVVVHDVLIHGGYDTCVRFGPRAFEDDPTPETTAFVHHLTCRLTEPSAGDPLAVFDVAAVNETVIADVVVELVEPGPLFRAQRRAAGDAGMVALDVPASFTVDSIAARGFDSQYDGFSDVDGVYSLTSVDTVGAMEPLFVGPTDSHLEQGSIGIDGGVDPAAVDPSLSLGTSLDGIDRTGQPVDRGCYEQSVGGGA